MGMIYCHSNPCEKMFTSTTLMVLLCFCVFPNVRAKIVGAFVLPHGGIALNPSAFQPPDMQARQWAWKIHKASVDIGQYIRNLQPDVIVLNSPHGVADLTKFVFYLNSAGNGSTDTDGCTCPPCCYTVSTQLDADLSLALAQNLTTRGLDVSGLSFFGPPGNSDEPAVLRWGETVPLTFIRELGRSKLVILSNPSKRYDSPVQMIPQLLDLGKKLYEILDASNKTVAMLISSDLAHTHQASGPYGFSPSAGPFDKACGDWVATLHPTYLLEVASGLVEKALSCGFAGLVMLHGFLEAGKLSSWKSSLYANYHPSYYGMLVASFTRNQTVFNVF